MIPASVVVPSIALAALVPAFAALYLVPSLKSIKIRYLAAAGIGLTLWFFLDTMGDAAYLDAYCCSLYPPFLFGGVGHFLLIIAFVLGISALAVFDRLAVPNDSGSAPAGKGSLFLIPAAVAFVMGIHSLGEGWVAVSPVSSGPVSSTGLLAALVSAFGTFPALVSYPIHKFLEASIIGVLYTAYVSRTGGTANSKWWQIPLLGLLFAGPAVLGAAAGYYLSFNTSYFFAFGVTSAFYALLRLMEPVAPGFKAGQNGPSRLGTGIFVAMAVGFFLLYTAALLH